jgi:hypothetical protein
MNSSSSACRTKKVSTLRVYYHPYDELSNVYKLGAIWYTLVSFANLSKYCACRRTHAFLLSCAEETGAKRCISPGGIGKGSVRRRWTKLAMKVIEVHIKDLSTVINLVAVIEGVRIRMVTAVFTSAIDFAPANALRNFDSVQAPGSCSTDETDVGTCSKAAIIF